MKTSELILTLNINFPVECCTGNVEEVLNQLKLILEMCSKLWKLGNIELTFPAYEQWKSNMSCYKIIISSTNQQI